MNKWKLKSYVSQQGSESPGLALGVFYLLLVSLKVDVEGVDPTWRAVIVILFLFIVAYITKLGLDKFPQVGTPHAGFSSIVLHDLNELSKIGHGQINHTDAIREIDQLGHWVQAVQRNEVSIRKADLTREYDGFYQALQRWSTTRREVDAENLTSSDRQRMAGDIGNLYSALQALTRAIDVKLGAAP